MIRWQCSSNIFSILTTTSLWLFISYSFKTTNASQRYPNVLPRCCGNNVNPYQVRNSRAVDEGPIGSCGTEGSDVVLLPKQFFPAMPTTSEYVEVELRNLVDGLNCDEESDEILIDFSTDLQGLTNVSLGTKKGFDEYAFSGGNFIDGTTYSVYSPSHYCVTSGTASKTRLDIKTCRQTCSTERPCIPRCCGGHQSILTSPPKSSDASFLSFCSTPSLEKVSWNLRTSKVVGGVTNQSHFYQTRYVRDILEDKRHSLPQGNCRLLRFTEDSLDDGTTLVLLEDGHLQLTLENTTEVLKNFCIDGINGGKGRRKPTGNSGDDCEVPEEQEVVVAYVCSPETQEETSVSLYDDILTFPVCSCLSNPSDQIFHLPLSLFPQRENETRTAVPVRLTAGSLECPEEYKDFTVDFKATEKLLFTEEGWLILNRSSLDHNQFCIRSMFHNAMRVRTCVEECSVERPCIHRCCSGNSHLDLKAVASLPQEDQRRMKCETQSSLNSTEWRPHWYNSVDDSHPVLASDVDVHPLIRKRRPYAESCGFFSPNKNEAAIPVRQYKLISTGDLMEKQGKKTWRKVNLEDYCIEPIMRPAENGELRLTGNPEDILVWRCSRDPKDSDSDCESSSEISWIGLIIIIAVITLLLVPLILPALLYAVTAVVYVLRKDKELVFRWSIVCFSFCMTFNYLFWMYFTIASFLEQSFYPTTCTVIGWFGHFVYLYGCLWITVLSFDIWLNITFLTPGKKSIKWFWGYVAFTITVSAAVVGTGVILELLQNEHDAWDPTYDLEKCFLNNQDGFLSLSNVSLGGLAFINSLLFIATAVKLWIAQRSNEIKTQRKTFLLYFKLFLVMEFPWGAQSLCWLFADQRVVVVAISAIGIFVYPVFLFFYLVWNADTKRFMETNYPRVKGAMDFIDGIGDGIRKRLCPCRRCKQPQDELGEATSRRTNDTPLASTHMHIHTKRLPNIPHK